jgi:uncharacterized membrane protein YfcA
LSLASDPAAIAAALSGVFIIAFMKGSFGGGAATVGIPLLALAMDPLTAGALLAPLLVFMDLFALRYFTPSTWSMKDLARLMPAMILGIAVGYFALRLMNRHMAEIAIAVTTLAFTAQWFLKRGNVQATGASLGLATLAGFASGVTTMVAHAGGPPTAMYLLRRGLSKQVFAGTMSIAFAAGNLIKLPPWLLVAEKPDGFGWLMLACLPVIPLAVGLGWRLHNWLDEKRLFQLCYALLTATSLKLLWDGMAGLA